MPAKKTKLDKYDILADAMRALRDENEEVIVETLNSKNTGYNTWFYGGRKPQLPVKEGMTFDARTSNRHYADSIKIGKDISIKRVYRPRARVKTDTGEYEVDLGWYYVVRTKLGEAKFHSQDADFLSVWNFALSKYEDPEHYHYGGYHFSNKKVYEAWAGPMVRKNTKLSKYDKAMKQLQDLGIEPRKLAEYIEKHYQKDK